jgi:hypothetical protein
MAHGAGFDVYSSHRGAGAFGSERRRRFVWDGVMAANQSKNLIFVSFGAAGIVGALCLLDMATGIPFARQMVFDILFLLSSAIVGYLAWDAYKDLA